MNNLETHLQQKFYDMLTNTSYEELIPPNLRHLSEDQLRERYDSLMDINPPRKPDLWEFAPAELVDERNRQEKEYFELFKSKSEILASELDTSEKELKLKERIERLDAMEYRPSNPPKEYDKSKYDLAIERYETELSEYKIINEQTKELDIILRNISALKAQTTKEVVLTFEVKNPLGHGKAFQDAPILDIPEGLIDKILIEDLQSHNGAWKLVENIILEVNFTRIPFNENIYKAFISYLQGHKIIREILFKKAAEEGKPEPIARFALPILNVHNSLDNDYFADGDHHYDHNKHIIVWRFPYGIILDDQPEYESVDNDGTVIFKGSADDLCFQTGAEENSHAFYFKEEERVEEAEEAHMKFKRGKIRYHSQPHELNALYGILAAYIVKYGSEENIPKNTYQMLMEDIARSVAEHA